MFIVTAKCILIEGKTEEFKVIVETLIKKQEKKMDVFHIIYIKI